KSRRDDSTVAVRLQPTGHGRTWLFHRVAARRLVDPRGLSPGRRLTRRSDESTGRVPRELTPQGYPQRLLRGPRSLVTNREADKKAYVVRLVLLIFLLVCSRGSAIGQSRPDASFPQPDWGRIIPQTNGTGLISLQVSSWPAAARLPLPDPFPSIT